MPKGDALVETIIKHIFLFPLLRLLGPFLFDCGPIKKLANVAMLFLGSKHLAHASFSNIHSCTINNQTHPTRLAPLSKQMVAPIHRPPSHHWQTWTSLSKQMVAPMHWPPSHHWQTWASIVVLA